MFDAETAVRSHLAGLSRDALREVADTCAPRPLTDFLVTEGETTLDVFLDLLRCDLTEYADQIAELPGRTDCAAEVASHITGSRPTQDVWQVFVTAQLWNSVQMYAGQSFTALAATEVAQYADRVCSLLVRGAQAHVELLRDDEDL